MGLTAVDHCGTTVVACTTCSRADARRVGEGRPGGARLAEALRRVGSDPDYADVTVTEIACLFACAEACTVQVGAPDKIGYVMGRFTPDEDSARAILDYARAHAASEWGEVPFPDWPDGVKGHFITRHVPPGYVAG